MTAAVVPGLAISRACDGMDALPNVRPPDWLDGVAGTLGSVEGRRVAGAAPGGRGAAAAEPQAEAGLGRPCVDRRPVGLQDGLTMLTCGYACGSRRLAGSIAGL